MNISTDFVYPADIEKVHAMLCDPKYRDFRARVEVEVEDISSQSPSADCVLTTKVPLPKQLAEGAAARFLGNQKSVEIIETISPLEDGSFQCEIKPASTAIPVRGTLTIKFTPQEETTIATVRGNFKVQITLFGATIEGAIAKRVPQGVEQELKAAEQYLSQK